jgi:membrane peptidoglycan carboxypeptidase
VTTLKRDRNPLADALALLACGILAGVLTAAAAFPLVATGGLFADRSISAFESLPTELTQPTLPQTTYVYASDGKTLITTFYEENRREVVLDDVAPVMVDALLAAEDSKFYEHNGVDWAGIMRAAVANQGGGDSQGASTVTMQLVRNTLIYSANSIDEVIDASEDTYDRKLREARYAMALEDMMSKEEILQGYLNVVYLGNQAYGIHAGSYTYFNKPPTELELHEAATLASLPKFPSFADGLLNGDGGDDDGKFLLDRRNWVIDRMAELDLVSKSEAKEAKERDLELDPRPTRSECVDVSTNNWGFFCDYFKEWWSKQEVFGETERDRMSLLKRGGFRIVTSLDKDLQKHARETIKGHASTKNPAALGSVTITPGTGHIRSMAVNRVYSLDQSENLPRTDGRKDIKSNYPNTTVPLLSGNEKIHGYPAGSTFKIFTMLAALEKGWPLATQIPSPGEYPSRIYLAPDEPGNAVCGPVRERGYKSWCPFNDGKWSSGPLDMWDMFGRSSNTAFVQLEELVSVTKAVEMAEKVGIEFYEGTEIDDLRKRDQLDTHGAFTLGFDPVTPLQMANSYATVAAKGKYCEPLPVMKIVKSDGEEWEEAAQPRCEQAISEDVAIAAASAGRCVVGQHAEGTRCSTNGTAGGDAAGFGRPLMGKTGTANANNSYWFVSATPNAANATFVGNPDQSRQPNLATPGLKTAVKQTGISVLKEAVKDLDEKGWPKPSGKMVNGEGLINIPSIGCENPESARSKVAGAGFEAYIAPGKFDSDCEEGQAFSTSITGKAPKGSPIYILVSNGSDYDMKECEDGTKVKKNKPCPEDEDEDDDNGRPGGPPQPPPGRDDLSGTGNRIERSGEGLGSSPLDMPYGSGSGGIEAPDEFDGAAGDAAAGLLDERPGGEVRGVAFGDRFGVSTVAEHSERTCQERGPYPLPPVVAIDGDEAQPRAFGPHPDPGHADEAARGRIPGDGIHRRVVGLGVLGVPALGGPAPAPQARRVEPQQVVEAPHLRGVELLWRGDFEAVEGRVAPGGGDRDRHRPRVLVPLPHESGGGEPDEALVVVGVDVRVDGAADADRRGAGERLDGLGVLGLQVHEVLAVGAHPQPGLAEEAIGGAGGPVTVDLTHVQCHRSNVRRSVSAAPPRFAWGRCDGECSDRRSVGEDVVAFGELAVPDGDGPFGAVGDLVVVGDHQDGQALGVQLVDGRQDLVGGLGVEVAGGLVAKQQARLGCQGARDGDALALTARQGRRQGVEAVAEVDQFELLAGDRFALAARDALVDQGHGDVLGRRAVGHEVEGLEDEPDLLGAQLGAPGLLHRSGVVAVEVVVAGRRSVEQAQQVEHGRLARAGGADDGDVLAVVDAQVDRFEGLDRRGPRIGHADAVEIDQRPLLVRALAVDRVDLGKDHRVANSGQDQRRVIVGHVS